MNAAISDIFWVFVTFSLVQPWLRQRLVEGARRTLIQKLEQGRKSRVILLIHREETLNLLGFPLLRYIDINDAEEVVRAIRLTDDAVPLDIVLHTPGGLVLASLQIARAIQSRSAPVTVFVPHYAMSGGTLIALAADEIVMDSHAVLGPVDPQIGEYPAASLLKVVRSKKIDDVDDRTLILAEVAEKALHQIRSEVQELLERKLPAESAKKLAEILSQGAWTHDHPISVQEAKALGLNVRSDMPPELYDLMALYPQPTRSRPSVEYIPVPYGPAGGRGERRP